MLTTGPARNAISYTARKFDTKSIYLRNGTLNPDKPDNFSGPPRDELDDAWRVLTGREFLNTFPCPVY